MTNSTILHLPVRTDKLPFQLVKELFMTNYCNLWRRMRIFFFFPFICWVLFSNLLSADTKQIQYHIKAYRTSANIKIDGELTEADWQEAQRINHFVQYEPDEGAPMTQSTEVKVLYDDKYIYFGFICYDSDLSKMVANEMRRDAPLFRNDYVFLLLDTYNDQRSGFFFRINPLGAMEDIAVMDNGDSRNENWSAVWECRTKINDSDWTAEIAIPFSQLRFKKSNNIVWGVNFGRNIQRNYEKGTWVPVPSAYRWRAIYRTANLGRLTGLENIVPQTHLELLPYILPGVNQRKIYNETNVLFDTGLDIKYSLTSNLTADATFNTDFVQVEADQEQVNLTRFSLFFPEKRPFFLESAALFDFGIPRTGFRQPPPLLLFYSRRIGIEEGHAIPILTGGKITGKIGSYGVGLLNVFTNKFQAEEIDVPRTNYSVLRMTRDLFKGSTVGMIAINKQNADTYNRAGGFDFVYRPVDSLSLRGLWARTFEGDVSGEQDALYFGGTSETNNFRVIGSYTDIGKNFNPEAGFVWRRGSRRIRSELLYTPLLGKFGIHRIWTGPESSFILNQNNELETRDLRFVIGGEFKSGKVFRQFTCQIQRTFDRLYEDFEIRESITIPTGKYNFTSSKALISTDNSKMISGMFAVNFGDFFKGERRGFEISADFRPSGRFRFQPQYEFNRVILENKTFDVNLFGAHVAYSFSTALYARLLAQWNSDQNLISTNFLVNYIYRPGSNFYLVFNQIYNTQGEGVDFVDSTLVAKMTYWWNP